MSKSWKGVDFDGTICDDRNGDPIWAMIAKVRLEERRGFTFKIFTARDLNPGNVLYIEGWCQEYLGHVLEITNSKDVHMLECWDDRARQVDRNTGEFTIERAGTTPSANAAPAAEGVET